MRVLLQKDNPWLGDAAMLEVEKIYFRRWVLRGVWATFKAWLKVKL
jgi:hypothetical protein